MGKHYIDPVGRPTLTLLAGTASALSATRRGPDPNRPTRQASFENWLTRTMSASQQGAAHPMYKCTLPSQLQKKLVVINSHRPTVLRDKVHLVQIQSTSVIERLADVISLQDRKRKYHVSHLSKQA